MGAYSLVKLFYIVRSGVSSSLPPPPPRRSPNLQENPSPLKKVSTTLKTASTAMKALNRPPLKKISILFKKSLPPSEKCSIPLRKPQNIASIMRKSLFLKNVNPHEQFSLIFAHEKNINHPEMSPPPKKKKFP